MEPRERVMCALAGGQPDRVPFCENSVDPTVARAIAGRSLSEREISEMLDRDNVVAVVFPPYFADQAVASHGQSYVTEGWIKTEDDLEKMIFPDPHDESLYANAQRILDDRGCYATVAAIKLGVAPTLVSMGLDGFAYALADDPNLVHEVLRRYVDWNIVVTEHLVEMGFDFVWSFDDVAYRTGPFFSPKVWREFILPAFRRSAEAITSMDIPWVFHSDGNLMPLLDDLVTLGMNSIHPIEPEAMALDVVKAKYGERVCLIGNVSVDILSRGTPDEVREEVRRCIATAGPGGGYMISASNSIPSYARPENVVAMAEAIREYAAYPLQM